MVAVIADERLDAFEVWLIARGEGAQLNRSIAAGFLAIAGKRPVTADDVAAGVALAREAGVGEVEPMERLGALLVEFEAIGGAQEPIAVARPPELAISIRTSRNVPRIDDAALAAAEPVVAGAAPRPRRPIAAIAGAVLVLGGIGAWWILRGDDAPEVASLDRIAALDLSVAFPAGWQVAHAKGRTALVTQGADHQAFVAIVRLDPRLADDALVTVARQAETAATAELAGAYASDGCQIAGEHVAVCRGAATIAGHAVPMQTYVRLGAKRAVLAMFTAVPDAAAIVDSFGI